MLNVILLMRKTGKNIFLTFQIHDKFEKLILKVIQSFFFIRFSLFYPCFLLLYKL
jgi:hypothetical protein